MVAQLINACLTWMKTVTCLAVVLVSSPAVLAQLDDSKESTYRSYDLSAEFLQPYGPGVATPARPVQLSNMPVGRPVITSVVPLNGQAQVTNVSAPVPVAIKPTPPSVEQIKAFNNPGYVANNTSNSYLAQPAGYTAFQNGGVVPAQFNSGEFNAPPAANFGAATTPSSGPIPTGSAPQIFSAPGSAGVIAPGSGQPYYNSNPNFADTPPALGSTAQPQVLPGTILGSTTTAAPVASPCFPGSTYPTTYPSTGYTGGTYVQPYAQPIVPQGSYRPILSFSNGLPPGTYLGQGIIGQPKAYVDGQPVRNFFRYIFP